MNKFIIEGCFAPEWKAVIRAANPLPDILWADGYILKKNGAALVCLCPFHDEGSPSFNLWPAKGFFKCFGCGKHGDVFTYVMHRENINLAEASKRLAARAGLAGFDVAGQRLSLAVARTTAALQAPHRALTLPTFRTSRKGELEGVAALRGLGIDGVQLAEQRGLLRFGEVCGFPCWIVTDSARENAQARRMDGQRFPSADGGEGRKAHTLRGARAAWPIGAREACAVGSIALVEGGPDLLAACHFVAVEGRERDVAPVAMLGASLNIRADALPLFYGKQVRIFGHLDASGAGQGATRRWASQLRQVGAKVDAFYFAGLRQADGKPVEDLNDLARLSADSFEAERGELERILP